MTVIDSQFVGAYGAVVGTIALLLNLIRFGYDRRRDSPQLRVTGRVDAVLLDNSVALQQQPSDQGSPKFLPEYYVTVRNVGLVPVFLENVGVVDEHGADVGALVDGTRGSFAVLNSLADANIDAIAPKSSCTFTVYRRRGQPSSKATTSFAIDRTGKRWAGPLDGG